MVARSGRRCQTTDWRRALGASVRRLDDLCQRLDLDPAALGAADARPPRFPLRVPLAFVARMERGNPDDPLLRQVLPLRREQRPLAGYSDDPVGDVAACQAPAVLRKYAGRALVLASASCPIHCRYCLRRGLAMRGGLVTAARRARTLAAIAAMPDLDELILSGGDPLMLDDGALAAVLSALAALPRLRRLRIHSRMPVALPGRVTDGLLALLRAAPVPTVLVIHVNHAAELGADAGAALARLRRTGITLLNQSVLLRGVNDRVETLAELSESLFAHGVLPYYLHRLDAVAGSAHFALPEPRARELIRLLRARLPGYLMPRPVREIRGGASKIPCD